MKAKEYNHIAIEKKWQKEWDKKKVYKTESVSKKPKYYVLDMFPYPSGAGLHVGHPRGYIASDVFARMKRMQGYNVLHPMGYDAFGLPAEQYAIQHKINPAQAVAKNVATFENQLSIIGLSYDWERRINTTDPEYYKWTQDIFLKIYDSYYDNKKRQARPVAELIKIFEKEGNVKINDFCVHSDTEVFSAKEWKTKSEKEKQDVLMKYRLAYEGYSEVNWCPGLGTVLANDEIVEKDGKQVSERGEFPVEKKSMRQWFMRITAYADRLIAGLDTLDWPENIKEIQRNWIGRREEIDGGKVVVRYNMRDAIFARQRYWGEPIPLKHTKDGLIMPLKVKELPLKLPNVKSYEPTGTGDSPLAGVSSWMKAGYETNTMPGWAGSSWYYLRYADPKNKKELASKKSLDYWMKGGVDMYVGGSEHATGHLLYSRFWHKVLKDYGIVQTEEPFRTLKNQGMILGPDHRKMSKRWGNVINPDEIVKTYGADTLRVYEMFMGPFDQMQPWNTESIIGSRRFIEKVWRLADKVQSVNSKKTDENTEKVLHKTIKKVTEDIENFSFNTAVSSMMICVNEMEKTEKVSTKDFKMFLGILAPFASHAVDDLWNNFGEKKSVHLSAWPKYDPKKLIEDKIKIIIQVNSKIRSEMEMSADATEEEIKSHAERNEKVLPWLEGKEIKKIIYVKGKLINILV